MATTTKNTIRILGQLLLVVAAVALGVFAYFGEFGGQIYTEIPASGESRHPGLGAVLFSSDTGYKVGMSPAIGRALASRGIPVIGVNSLAYFRLHRDETERAEFIADAIGRGLAQPGTRRLLLVGQSFGADMLHAGLAHIPAALRARIVSIVLVVPGSTVEYRASPAETLTFGETEYPAMPTASTIDWAPLLCIHGAEEEHSLCRTWTQPNVRILEMPGGHLLNRDNAAVSAAILAFADATDSGK